MLDYDKEERIALEQNTRKLRSIIAKGRIPPDLKTKIESYCKKHCIEYEFVEYKIRTDDLFLVNFVKEPNRQTMHQKRAADYINNLNNVSDFTSLVSGGDGSKYVHGGIVLPYSQIKESNTHTKSIDFEWGYTNNNNILTRCYATHKYTKENGGSQDNQFKDVQQFLSNSISHAGRDYFYAICDGAYYQQEYKKYENRIAFLNATYSGIRCFTVTVNDLEKHMTNHL